MSTPNTFTLLALLAALVAVGPLSTDMYLPALPIMTVELGAGVDQVQLTLSVFLIGFAVAQLVYGPLSDRFGRKPVLAGGMLLFILATVGCALAPGVEALILFRFIQALGGCAGPVLGRAIVRDLYRPEEAGRMLSYMGTAMALAPALAPVLGGYLVVALGWRSVFWFLALYGVLGTWLYRRRVAESNRHPDPGALVPRRLLANYATLARDRRYLGYVLCCSFVFAGLFAFISGSSFVLIQVLGVSTQQFGYCFALVVLGYIAGTLTSARLSHRLGVDRLLVVGTWIAAGAGLAMALPAALEVRQVAAVLGPMVVFMAGAGIVMPQAMAGAIGPYPQMAGAASALFGFIQSILGALGGVAVGQLHDGSPLPMALIIAAMGLATVGTRLWLLGGAPLAAEVSS